MSKWLWLASLYLMDAVGLDECHELYCVLVTQSAHFSCCCDCDY